MAEDKDVRVIALKCPNCGGALRVPEGADRAVCDHCKSTVLVLDGVAGPASPHTSRSTVQLTEEGKKRLLKIVLWGTAISVGLPVLTTILVFIILAVVFLIIGFGFIGSGR